MCAPRMISHAHTSTLSPQKKASAACDAFTAPWREWNAAMGAAVLSTMKPTM